MGFMEQNGQMQGNESVNNYGTMKSIYLFI
jgi:hypothetical protein